MKSLIHIITRTAAAALLLALCATAASAQQEEPGRLRLDNLDRLTPLAVQTVRVDVDINLIKIGCQFLSETDPEERQVKEMCRGLKGVFVRGFEFKAEGQYADADVTALREQLRAPVWTRIFDFSNREGGLEKAEVYAASEGGRVQGLAVLIVDPKELTVVNVVGAIDLAKLRQLGTVLEIPRIRIERKRRNVVRSGPRQQQ